MGQDQAFSLTYDRFAFQDLAKLDSFWQDEILSSVELKLRMHPEVFGKPLRQSLKGCRALRVGDYRVVFRIERRLIRVLAVVHRSSNYKGVEQRI